jgi:predicted Zn finger-like uncharacterized protein
MSLVTKCTQCATTFRVTSQQLQAHGGRVRCGSCMAVFDGLQALVTLPDTGPEPTSPLTREAAEASAAAFVLEPVEPAATAQPAPPRAAEPLPESGDDGPAPEQLALDDELFPRPAPRGARWWAAGSVLLLFALAAQAAHFYRSDLAVQYPALKPLLVQMCGALRCKVSPPQRPRQIMIEASDLQVNDPAKPGVIQLTATLRNHASYDLGYPAIDLVLTNTREHTLARRIFLPREYLGAGRDPGTGIPADAEVTVRLDLDTGDLNPAGFRLDLLPAPAP